jgi:superfamily II DNA or RNA helicase
MNEKVWIITSSVLYVKGLSKALRSRAIQDLSRPNPEYVDRERLGKWTGDTLATICLVKSHGDDVLQLPRGYMERLQQIIEEAGVIPIVRDRRLKELPLLNVEFRGELFPYQVKALEAMTRYESGILTAPCGSGKTALGCALIAHWRRPSLVLIHTKDLLRQTCGAVRQWLGVDPGVVGDGKYNVRPVTVATVQTLSKRPDIMTEIKERFGLVLLDEVHHSPATSFMETIQQFPAISRFGLTATPKRRDGLWPFAEAVIGPVRHTITDGELRESGRSVIPEIRWVQTTFSSYETESWVDLMRELVTDERRNRQIIDIILRALDDERRVIALSERVAHVELLAERLNSLRPGSAVLATGQSKKKDREAAVHRMGTGEARVLFATKLADEGLDLPELDCLILATPSRDGARTMQRVGRILRALSGKRQPVVYDIVDSRVGMLASQARSRFFDCYRAIVPGSRLPEWLETRRRVVA